MVIGMRVRLAVFMGKTFDRFQGSGQAEMQNHQASPFAAQSGQKTGLGLPTR
jgi:hypothetical protein